MSLIIPSSQTLADTGFSIDNSCRFDGGSSPNMTRTPSGASNQKTFTLSVWLKLGADTQTSSYYATIFTARTGSSSTNSLMQMLDDGGGSGVKLHFSGGSGGASCKATGLLRDLSAWYHVVYKIDSTESTDTDRVKIYINGEETTLDSPTYPTLNVDFNYNSTAAHHIGSQNSTDYFDGYMAEMHFIDGTALTPSSFGEAGDYGEWKPIEVSGLTYGTNGFYLDFADSGDLGDDESGNGNDYAETNLSAHDQMTDTPTNNFATFNRLDDYLVDSFTLTEGNLKSAVAEVNDMCFANFGMDSGKWYWEVEFVSETGTYSVCGIANQQASDWNSHNGTWSWANSSTGFTYNKDTSSSDDTSHPLDYSAGDVLHFAVDADNGKLWWGVGGTWMDDTSGNVGNPAGDAYPRYSNLSVATSALCPMVSQSIGSGNSAWLANFGQDGTFAGTKTAQGNSDGNGYGNFYYAPPSGFLALCSKNLPDCAITPNENFSAIIYTGNGGTQSITPVGFQPDLVWLKCRTVAHNHEVIDSVRGATKRLRADNDSIEATIAAGLTSFDSTGFSVGNIGEYNQSTKPYVAWCWKANGSGSSNEDGSINTTATSANVDAGFSISTYAGNSTGGATVGHGLSVAPNLVIVKRRDVGGANWPVGSVQPLASMDFTDFMMLDTNNASSDSVAQWNDVAPTASVVSLGTQGNNNATGSTYVMYCWHSVEGYSKIGYYLGNAAVDGPFVYTGFSTAYVIRKRINGANSWDINDIARNPYNIAGNVVYADTGAAETPSDNEIDFLSNGFKMRATDTHGNASGGHYLYMAFAETPFKNATAR